MVPDQNVVYLLDSSDDGDHAEVDLLLGEGIGWEAGRESEESLSGGVLVDRDDLVAYPWVC